MPRVKRVTGRFDMEVTYDVTETTTHKTTLENGIVMRSDLNGLYVAEKEGKVIAAFKGHKDFFWAFPTKEIVQVADCTWEEDTFERNYEMVKDVS